jgi:hypothetical protein
MAQGSGRGVTPGVTRGVTRGGVGLVWLALGLFVLHAGYLAYLRGPFCVDDAYISFRYAASLLDGQGLVFNAGERVEGYTNFGWGSGSIRPGRPVP